MKAFLWILDLGNPGRVNPVTDKLHCLPSPLYRRGYRIDTVADISMELGSTRRIVVQVHDKTLNAWARSLLRKHDGHIYFISPNRTRWFQGVNTWLAVDTVQKYMRECGSFPRNPQKLQPLSTPRFRSVMDFVATLRAAASSPAAAFCWFSHSLLSQLVISCALHYMSPWQCFSIQNAQPQPQWVTDALLGPRQGEERESGTPIDPAWTKWDITQIQTVYYGFLPSFLINIVHDGFYREVGQGENRMQEVCGCSVEGVYCTDRLEDALNSLGLLASGGPTSRAGYVGSELISEDGTIPLKVVIRYLADTTGLLWRREERNSRLFCFMPDALLITHIYCVGQHPHTVWHGTTHDTAKFTHLEARTPAGEVPPFSEFPLEPWSFKDPERFFTDDRPTNDEQHQRTFMYYQDYAGKYGSTRFDSIDFSQSQLYDPSSL